MKLALVSTYLPQECGIATYTSYLVNALLSCDSSLKINVIAENLAEKVDDERLNVLPVWSRNEDYVFPILSHIKDIDYFHIQHEYGIYGFDDRLLRLLDNVPNNVKKVLTLHCIRTAQFSDRNDTDEKFSYYIANKADRVIVHMNSQKSILLRLGIKPDKIHIIPHGTFVTNEDKLFSRKKFNLPIDAKIILLFGFLKPHKCYEVAIKSLAYILKKRKDVYIVIAGTLHPAADEKQKEYLNQIYKTIDEFNVKDNVIFLNKFFPDKDVPYLMAASDIILFHYYEEDYSSSGALHLAIGAGKPIVATRIAKFEEIKNISDELLILPFNVEGLSKVILRIIEDDEFRNYVIERTKEYRKKTSWKSVAKEHLKVYKMK